MDVRCERCGTVYEFDDGQVSDRGINVKCAECGHLFKLKKKPTTRATPVGNPVFDEEKSRRQTSRGIPRVDLIPHAKLETPEPAPTPMLTPTPAPAPFDAHGMEPEPAQPAAQRVQMVDDDRPWMLRLHATSEIFRFRDMTTLENWVLEGKVEPRDELSRNGVDWRELEVVPELKNAFSRVTVPLGGSRSKAAIANELALSTTAPIRQPNLVRERDLVDPALESGQGPTQMGSLYGDDDANTAESDEFAPRRRGRAAVIFTLVFVGLVGGATALLYRQSVEEKARQKVDHARESLAAGRTAFVADTDDSLRHAATQLDRALGADEGNVEVLAMLAEVHATHASALREEADRLEADGPAARPAVDKLRREAQGHLIEAKRYADEAFERDGTRPDVNRAMADVLVVGGGAAAEVDRFLQRTLPSDAAALYVRGLLAFREGKLNEAEDQLQRSLMFDRKLCRSSYLLARVFIAQGKKDAAKKLLIAITEERKDHERAQALLASLDAPNGPSAPGATASATTPAASSPSAPTPTSVNPTAASAASVVASAAPSAVPTSPFAAPPSAVASAAPSTALEPNERKRPDYNRLILDANHYQERGRSREAKKLYEQALVLQPDGPEALTGLGYCDLDGERFFSAIDRFKLALAIAPEYGDALIGLAEAYKVHGDLKQSLDFYQRYLKAQPRGPRAAMAQKNAQEIDRKLNPKTAAPADATKSDTPERRDEPPANEGEPPP